MKRFMSMFLVFFAVMVANSILQYYLDGDFENRWIVVGPILLLVLFLYFRPHLICGECGYPALKDSNGAWSFRLREHCLRCGAERKQFSDHAATFWSRETMGHALQMFSVGGTLFLVLIASSLLAESNGLTVAGLITFAVFVTPISLLLVGAWKYGSRLVSAKSK